MTNHYLAKVSIEEKSLVFEINEDIELVEANKFAKRSVESWLESHGSEFEFEEIKIRVNDKEINYQ